MLISATKKQVKSSPKREKAHIHTFENPLQQKNKSDPLNSRHPESSQDLLQSVMFDLPKMRRKKKGNVETSVIRQVDLYIQVIRLKLDHKNMNSIVKPQKRWYYSRWLASCRSPLIFKSTNCSSRTLLMCKPSWRDPRKHRIFDMNKVQGCCVFFWMRPNPGDGLKDYRYISNISNKSSRVLKTEVQV